MARQLAAEPLTPDEVAALISQCSLRAPTGVRNRALITLLYRSGLRISEALALRPADLNMAKHSIRLLDTKSGQPQTRGYHASADDALARWLDVRKQLAADGGWKNGPLFCTLDGGQLQASYVRSLLPRLADAAGIAKRVHAHGLRHTFAVELEQAGTPVTAISKLLGHSSIAVTHRYLDHLTNGQAVEALQSVALPDLAPAPARTVRMKTASKTRSAQKPAAATNAPSPAPQDERPAMTPTQPQAPQQVRFVPLVVASFDPDADEWTGELSHGHAC